MTKFQLIVITPEDLQRNEFQNISLLLENGLDVLHLRKPGMPLQTYRSYLKNISEGFHPQLVIHEHFELVSEFNVMGIHLSERQRNDPKFITRLNSKKIVSASFHAISDLKQSRRKYDHVFLSPVFDSISKSGHNSSFNLTELKKDLEQLKKTKKNLPGIIALGGVDEKNVIKAKELGFSGAALLGAVWKSKEPLLKLIELKQLLVKS